MTTPNHKFILKKGTEFIEIRERGKGNIYTKAFKDIQVDLIQKKLGLTYFRLNNRICKTVLAFIILVLAPISSYAYPPLTDSNAILAIVGEAENQGYRGMLAVAHAIRNRHSLKGVYGYFNPRTKKASPRTILLCRKAWLRSANQADFTQGATLWDNIKAFGIPNWDFTKLTKTYEYKDHVFYKPNHNQQRRRNMNVSVSVKIRNAATGTLSRIKSEQRNGTTASAGAFIKTIKAALPNTTTVKKGKDRGQVVIKTDGKTTLSQKYKGIDSTEFVALKSAIIK